MADAAQLKLQVGLDLAFFRQQLALLGTTATSYSLPINIDRLGIQNEITKLGRNISGRKYRLEIATNIASEIKNAGTLAKALRGLDNAIQKNKGVANRTGGGAAGSVIDASKLERSLKTATKPVLESVYNEMDRLGIRMAKAANEAGKTTNESLRAAILSGIPQVTADMAQGLAKGINPSMKINGQKGAKLFIEAWKDAAGIASPSKVFKALGEFSADGLEIGFINGLKDFKNKSVDEIRKIVALLKLELAKISGVSMAPAMTRSAGGRGSQGYMSPIGPLPHGSREPWAFSQGGYQPFMAQPGQRRGAGASRAGAPSIMGTTSSPSMFGASFPALPSAGMTGGGGAYRQAQLQSRMAAAYTRSAAREASVLGESQMYARVSGQVPLGNPAPRLPAGNQGGALALRNAPGGGQGGAAGFGGFANAMAGIQLPGAGLVSELGGEFAMAAKQVLLFGTAYKALAFLTDFPAQVSEAVAQLQTFNNTLKAITPSSDEFRASNQFILDTVDKYNVPLQSAREGFTNLYASMQPAGFKGNEIRDIFTGVSQAAATFGMSADKVDRVNYAFAQMASKGQVMSEELKGQLGDVLPGAVAIFAKAAGFTGPNAMVDFTKAMEDGRYKGEAMKQLLINVGIVMKDKFAKGAEGAAQSFQGQMNAMATATKKLYESFAPVANLFASNVVKPLTEGLQVVADGFNAFFTGAAAKTGGGFAISQELERLKPTLEGLRANLAGLVPSFQLFGSLLLNVAKALAVVASNPITGFLLKVYANVLLVNTAFTLLGGRILVGLIANIGLATSRLFAMNAAFFALQRTSAVTNSTLAGTQLQMMLLQRNAAGVVGPVNLLLGSLLRMAAIGAIAIAITIAITNADELRDAERRLARLRGERDPVGPEGPKPVMTPARRFTGASRETVQGARAAQAPLVIQYRKELKVLQQQLLTAKAIAASSEDNAQASVANVQAKTAQARVDAKVLDIQNAQGILNLNPGSFKTAKEQQASSLSLPPIPVPTGDGGSKGSAADDAKRVAEQIKQQLKSAQDLKFEQQNRLTLLRAENDFTKAFTSFSIQRLEIERRYSELLKQSMSPEETATLQQARSAEYKQSSLTLQQQINDLLKQAQAPLNDAVESIKNQAAFEREYGELIKNGTNPEVAKQVIAIRKAYNESVKLLEPALAAAQAAVTKANAEGASATEIQKYREELEKIEAIRKGLAGKKAEGEAAAAATPLPPKQTFKEGIAAELKTVTEQLEEMTKPANMVIGLAKQIGSSFSEAFVKVLDGTASAQEALGGLFKNIGDYLIQYGAQMMALAIMKGILGLFGNGAAFDGGGITKNAKGNAFNGSGIAKFATGGIVNGPTLFPFADGGAMQMGLMGEAGPEAIMPLQRGADGSLGVRAAMGGNGMGGSSSPILNMNFETSTINGVEYVSRDQLELAMAQTRRQASSDGAKRGMTMTLDKIQQSPQTRRRIGM